MEVIQGSFGATAADEEDNATVIAFLEEALKQAKLQRATHALLIMRLADDAVFDGWSRASMMRPYIMLGALTEITQRYIRKNIEHD